MVANYHHGGMNMSNQSKIDSKRFEALAKLFNVAIYWCDCSEPIESPSKPKTKTCPDCGETYTVYVKSYYADLMFKFIEGMNAGINTERSNRTQAHIHRHDENSKYCL